MERKVDVLKQIDKVGAINERKQGKDREQHR